MRVDITVSQLISVDPGSHWIYVDDYPLCLWYAIISYYCFSSLVSLHQRHSSLSSVLLTESFGYLELKSFQIVPQAILSSSTWIIQHLLQCLNKQYPRLALFDLNLPQKSTKQNVLHSSQTFLTDLNLGFADIFFRRPKKFPWLLNEFASRKEKTRVKLRVRLNQSNNAYTKV